VARTAAKAGKLEHRLEFIIADERSVSLPSERFEFVFWRSAPGFSGVEAVLDFGTAGLRQNSALYASYTGLGGSLRGLERALQTDGRDWSAPSRRLLADRMYRSGIGAGLGDGTAPGFDDLLAIADSRGLALVDRPRIAGGPTSFLGMPVTVEALFRRERRPGWCGDELLGSPVEDPAFLTRVGELFNRGAPRLVADVLGQRLEEIRGDDSLRRLLIRALLKVGRGRDTLVDELAGSEKDPLTVGLVHHARGALADAVAAYAKVDPVPQFLVGAAHLESGDLVAAGKHFAKPPTGARERLDCAFGLLEVAARQGDREAGRRSFERLVRELAGNDHRPDELSADRPWSGPRSSRSRAAQPDRA
jgi:hypothetical protein